MAKTASKPTELMVVNETPGEECRIAVLENNHLEELYSERTATATNVGNIYKARVAKVEPAIQAAFVDYGKGQSGFLHITDLHPKYFPSGNRKEKVGKRVPRRDRPPIQDALRPGDELLVQVLKEGIGTKGPTLTSYLSIPGRLLVVMPDMDNVGVSRKVEDDVKRREMRQMLDGLDLPEHFGFIVRTAGFGRTKTELKRDVAYLMRLWKVMDRRIKTVGAPCELYTESDLLIRTIRDVLRPTVDAIVVDSESAYERVKTFLEVIAPRSAPNVIRYHSSTPIFHAFDIERQIELIHSREVPLPSGGAIVIEQTEALVAIDVNSGRSRSARDSETNAYETNCEAVDEICRQLRLRDLGGLVVCDLIDMRAQRHRREVEDRFRNHMKKDRAKSTILKISDFGILQLTRQRMRPSLRKAHFMPCPSCDGHGEIQMPESLSADVVRQVGYLLQFEKIRRLELVCSSQVASVLLSTKRRQLVRIEDVSGKRVDVRVSDAIAIDRIDFYAYDQRGADVDISRLPQPQIPTIKTLEADARTAEERIARDGDDEHAADENGGRKKRGRRRRRKAGPADATAIALAGDWSDDDAADDAPIGTDAAERPAADTPDRDAAAPPADGEAPRRRRRRRRGRSGRGQTEAGA
ncbi:MAG: Rne/Rng family ribonuclease, partial [Phycisphaerales bacterium]|nr:Rne/Rng family ribonuclease [Phycisphaerales bacterium]